jgi:predicted molibdopterin-dependent oxidoreductase YjgC
VGNHLSTCTFCGVGCGIYLETRSGEITGVYPSMSSPANLGRICVRGWHVHEVASSPDRLRTPLIRKNNTLVPATFEEAYDLIAKRLSEIKKQYGPDSIGFLDSARCGNEDGYLLQKFARSVIGTNNIDQGTSFYRKSTIDVLRSMLGVAAATSSINDIFSSKAIILNNIDIGQQLPTIGGAIIRAKLGGAKLIVVGERKHRLTEHADIFLNTKPGTEGYLYAAMAKIIIDRGLIDFDFISSRCKKYEEFLENIQSFDLLFAARHCDIDASLIEQAALMYADNKPGMLLFGAGAEDIGVGALSAMVNLVLLTGNIGKQGAGIIPLAEHNNTQGGCDMGVIPQYLPGYVSVSDAAGRAHIEKYWKTAVPQNSGLDSTGMFAANSPIKALWLDRHNPIVSASYKDAGDMLKKMDFVVLQNLFMTKTADHADVVLPVAAYGEEDVTFTSTERRIQHAVKAIDPPKDLTSAWQQLTEVANRMGAAWSYSAVEDVLREIASVVPDYSGVTFENISRDYGRQWPCTLDHPMGTPLLFSKHKSGQSFYFSAVHFSPIKDTFDKDYPFVLSFGHSLYYWHQNTLIRHSETLKREYGILLLDYPEGFVEINDEDAKKLSVRDTQAIQLVSATGVVKTHARVTPEVRRGAVFVPFFIQDVMRSIGRESSTGHDIKTLVRIEKAG